MASESIVSQSITTNKKAILYKVGQEKLEFEGVTISGFVNIPGKLVDFVMFYNDLGQRETYIALYDGVNRENATSVCFVQINKDQKGNYNIATNENGSLLINGK